MKNILLGTAGHVDHGKTALIKALTGVDTDRLKEEKERGITIELGFTALTLPHGQRIGIVDVPGHERFVKNMVAGGRGIDMVLLVIAADEGVMPQTREHILLARQVGVPYIVVFMNKVDMVDDPELLELVELEIRDLLSSYEFPGDEVPVIKGSALKALENPEDPKWAQPIWDLVDALDKYVPQPQRDIDKPFLMPIEDIFTITGRGTVVTGRVERGILKTGDPVEIVGLSFEIKKSVATSIEMFRKILDEAQAGDNVGVLLRGIDHEEVEKGMVLAAPGSIKPYRKFQARVYILSKEEGGRHKPFLTGYKPQFFLRTTDVTGTVTLPEGVQMAMPGDNVDMTVELIYPVALEETQRFAIREGGKTVGAGVITKVIE